MHPSPIALTSSAWAPEPSVRVCMPGTLPVRAPAQLRTVVLRAVGFAAGSFLRLERWAGSFLMVGFVGALLAPGQACCVVGLMVRGVVPRLCLTLALAGFFLGFFLVAGLGLGLATQ